MTGIEDSEPHTCSICHDDVGPFLVNLCNCRGTVARKHEACLRKWMNSQTDNGVSINDVLKCGVCKTTYSYYYERKATVHLFKIVNGICSIGIGLSMVATGSFIAEQSDAHWTPILLKFLSCVVDPEGANQFNKIEDMVIFLGAYSSRNLQSLSKMIDKCAHLILEEREAFLTTLFMGVFYSLLTIIGVLILWKGICCIRSKETPTISMIRFVGDSN
eukprot:TRINITY_DN17985_c0_g1_i1.p1 TRINITY_DN17985_c0_g1~~TRINITY_DN17985_c0_g1_i1.p1  ORF type:complete len:217 (+),score=15.20 TRINITY_DN17985_c0_g1_i1:75-725(+)